MATRLWLMFTGVIYGVAAIVMDQAGQPGRIPLLIPFALLSLAGWVMVARSPVGPTYSRRVVATGSFILVTTGMSACGEWLYPGLFASGSSFADRVYISLTLSGWIAAGPITSLLLAVGQVVSHASTGFRWRTWWQLTWPHFVTIAYMVGAWWLLRPHGQTLGTADAYTWAEAALGRDPWPVPPVVLGCLAILWAWSHLLEYLHRLLQHRPSKGQGTHFLLAATAWACALGLTAPLWYKWVHGFRTLGSLTEWPAIWASAVVWPPFLLIVCTLSLATVLATQAIGYLSQVRHSGPRATVPPISIHRGTPSSLGSPTRPNQSSPPKQQP